MMQMKNERISEQWSRKTTLHYQYLRMLALAETRLRNEAREITGRQRDGKCDILKLIRLNEGR